MRVRGVVVGSKVGHLWQHSSCLIQCDISIIAVVYCSFNSGSDLLPIFPCLLSLRYPNIHLSLRHHAHTKHLQCFPETSSAYRRRRHDSKPRQNSIRIEVHIRQSIRIRISIIRTRRQRLVIPNILYGRFWRSDSSKLVLTFQLDRVGL